MKQSFLSALLLLSFSTVSYAQSRPGQGSRPHPAAPAASASRPLPTTISAARQAGPGATVTVRGVVSNGAELGQLRFVQDATAGLAVFSTTSQDLAALVPGDSVQLTGTLKNYSGLLEMDPVASVQKLGSGRRLSITEVPAADMARLFDEAYEGRMVRIKGVSSLTTTSGEAATAFAGNTNYLLNGQRNAPIRIHVASKGATGLVDKAAPTEDFDVVGTMSQFTQTGTGGYQLLPHLGRDIVVDGGLPVVLGEPVPTAISRTGFTVSFQTRYPGDTKVEYGKTTALGSVLSSPAPTKVHALELADLEPGTVYYVRVSSTNAAGTSTSAAVPIITDTKKRAASR